MERDFEMFLRDVEEDADLRNTVALYKAQQREKKQKDNDRMEGVDEASVAETDDDEGSDDVPKINMEELLDEFNQLDVEDEDEE